MINNDLKACEARALAQTRENENDWKLYEIPKSIIDGKTNFVTLCVKIIGG